MAKWTQIPSEPLYHQPDQAAFLEARRLRFCRKCKKEFKVLPPEILVCPTCGEKGSRAFDHLAIIAGRRWGKSRIGSIAGTEEATIPNTIGWACAPTIPKLHRYVIPAFQQLIDPEWVDDWNVEFKDLRLKNGSLIHFQTLEDPDQGRGQGLDWLWIDEICELTKRHWEVISPSLSDRRGVAFFTSSPRSYDWVYEELYKPAEDSVPGFWACHAKTKDNPIFQTEDGAAHLASKRARMSDAMYRQEYEADFVIFTGAVYGGLIDPQILRTRQEIERVFPEWPQIDSGYQVIVGVDTGADHPFGAVKIVSTEKGLVIVGEYLERHKTFIQHAGALKALAGNPNARWAINKNELQPSIELAQHGINCMPAQNDIVAGTERVKSWLQNHQLWIIEETCPQTIKQMKAYRWAEPKTTTGEYRAKEKVYKLDDELPDCIRYALMTWPSLPTPAKEEVKERDLSKLPGEMRATIERMRKIYKEPKEINTVEEFWG